MSNPYLLLLLLTTFMAGLGIFAAWKTRDTHWPFIIGFNTLLPATLIILSATDGVFWRKVIILSFVLIYLLRMNWVLFVWFKHTGAAKLKDQMPLNTLLSLPVILTIIFSCVYTLPFWWAVNRSEVFTFFDGLALLLYIVGTIFHFGADYQKYVFKQNPANKGKLLTSGLWGFSRHPNYFGDFLIFVSFAALSASPFGLLSPLVNFLQYYFDAIPKNEAMAQQRYGKEWDNYVQKVRCLIPFLW